MTSSVELTPVELRKLAARFDLAGQPELARKCRNRAAARELGVRHLDGLDSGLNRGRSSLVQMDAYRGTKTPRRGTL